MGDLKVVISSEGEMV